jgi:hypothetical protein
MHFFGEAAVDRNFNKALVNGLLMSVDQRVDISFIQRTIAAAYQSVYGNAFTENTYPTNENGFYAGMSIRPVTALQLDVYADVFRFPWLRYQSDAPGSGTDFLIQLIYTPNKQAEIYARYRAESKPGNEAGDIPYLVNRLRQSWQIQVSYPLHKLVAARCRIDMVWFGKKPGNKETGFLSYIDLIYKPMGKKYNAVLRLQYFETGGYNSRVYAYENDVLYSSSVPAFYQKGVRYYFILGYDVNKKTSCWLRFARTISPDQVGFGSGADAIYGATKTEIKAQVSYTF